MWEVRIGVLVRYGTREGPIVLHIWDSWAIGAVLDALEVGVRSSLQRRRIPPTRGDRLRDVSQRLFDDHLSSAVPFAEWQYRSRTDVK